VRHEFSSDPVLDGSPVLDSSLSWTLSRVLRRSAQRGAVWLAHIAAWCRPDRAQVFSFCVAPAYSWLQRAPPHTKSATFSPKMGQ